jgi:Family of unknown function (DUF5829)
MRQLTGFLYLVLSAIVSTNAKAQINRVPVFLNHLYFVLDSNSYAHIFDSAFLQQIGNTTEKKTTTTGSSWSGKYLNGLDSYFEVFAPKGFTGATEGNIGFGFMTFKQGDINKLEANWKADSKDSVKRDTSILLKDGIKLSWFYSLSLYSVDSFIPASAWVMENTPDMLKARGFTEEEIKKPISWGEFVEKRSKTKFTKAFNRITSVEIITNKKEFDYLNKSFLGFGLKEKNNTFFNDYISIKYSIADIPSTELKEVEIELNNSFKEQTIFVSPKFSLHVKDKSARLVFIH